MTHKWRTFIVAVLFGLVAAACGGAATDTASEIEVPAEAEQTAEAEQPVETGPPSIFDGNFVDLNGESIDLASFEGQDVVLWFWAPW